MRKIGIYLTQDTVPMHDFPLESRYIRTRQAFFLGSFQQMQSVAMFS